jgi:hypothetical protein
VFNAPPPEPRVDRRKVIDAVDVESEPVAPALVGDGVTNNYAAVKAMQPAAKPREAAFPMAEAAPLIQFETLQAIINGIPHLAGDERKEQRREAYAKCMGLPVVPPPYRGKNWSPGAAFHAKDRTEEQRAQALERAKDLAAQKFDEDHGTPAWMDGPKVDPITAAWGKTGQREMGDDDPEVA